MLIRLNFVRKLKRYKERESIKTRKKSKIIEIIHALILQSTCSSLSTWVRIKITNNSSTLFSHRTISKTIFSFLNSRTNRTHLHLKDNKIISFSLRTRITNSGHKLNRIIHSLRIIRLKTNSSLSRITHSFNSNLPTLKVQYFNQMLINSRFKMANKLQTFLMLVASNPTLTFLAIIVSHLRLPKTNNHLLLEHLE